jgi:putative glutamine amidotransferase
MDSLAHGLRVLPEATAIGERLSRETPLVNSRHHQAIKELAPGLTAAAFSPDGLVEAFELAFGAGGEDWWLRGVQWHPENLIAMALHRNLWADFVAEVEGSLP